MRLSYTKKAVNYFIGILLSLPLALTGTEVLADPPPWAPAHGYYKKQPKHPYKYEHDRRRVRTEHGYVDIHADIPPGGFITNGRCRRENIGKAVGAVLGGVAGAQIGDNEPVAIIAGAIFGFVLGGSIGRSMDEQDRACVGQTLEYAGDRETIKWQNPDSGIQYEVTPTKTFRADQNYCREYTRTATIAGKPQTVYGKACRQPDGTWRIEG